MLIPGGSTAGAVGRAGAVGLAARCPHADYSKSARQPIAQARQGLSYSLPAMGRSPGLKGRSGSPGGAWRCSSGGGGMLQRLEEGSGLAGLAGLASRPKLRNGRGGVCSVSWDLREKEEARWCSKGGSNRGRMAGNSQIQHRLAGVPAGGN